MDLVTGALLFLLPFLGTTLGLWFASFVKSHGGKTGELRAIQDNLREVLAQLQVTTKTVEDVKREVTGGLWLDQQRWQLRKDVYVPLLMHLDRLKKGVSLAVSKGRSPEQRVEVFRSVLDRQAEDPDVLKAKALAQLVLPATLLSAIGQIEDELGHLGYSSGANLWLDSSSKRLGQYAGLVEVGCDQLIKDARRDLELLAPPAEDPEAIERREAFRAAIRENSD